MTKDEFEVKVTEKGDDEDLDELFFLLFPTVIREKDGDDWVDRFREMVCSDDPDFSMLVGVGSSMNYWSGVNGAVFETKDCCFLIDFDDVFFDRDSAEEEAVKRLVRFFTKGGEFFKKLNKKEGGNRIRVIGRFDDL
jgi:hypothetical protein